MTEKLILEFKDVDTYYGDLHVLKKVNYTIAKGEIVSLLGGNACGKSTTMKTIMGIVRPTRGQVLFEGVPIEKLPTAERVKRRGIAPVLEARRLFPRMTVYENLEMGAYTLKRGRSSGSISNASTACSARKRAPAADRRHPFRRRAADGCHRSGVDGSAPPDLYG